MRWVLVSDQRSVLQEYHLMDGDDCKVLLKYNPLHHSARICYEHTQHQLFYIEKTGQISSKTSFTNKYGMEIGSLNYDKWDTGKGTLVIDEKKYHFSMQNNLLPRLVIYENDPSQPLISCSLEPDNSNTEVVLLNNTPRINNSCFLLTLCWYLFLPLAKENALEYA